MKSARRRWPTLKRWVAVWVALSGIRLLIEVAFPIMPFVTDNSLWRIAAEWPFLYPVALGYELVGVRSGHWNVMPTVAVLESACITLLVGMIGWIARRIRRGGVAGSRE